MALQWMRNPDRSVTADEPRWWSDLHADVTVTASGYNSTNGWTASSVDGYGIKYPRVVTDPTGFADGCRIKLSGTPAAEKVVLAKVDDLGAIQCCVTITTARKLRIYRGNIATALTAASDDALAIGTWYKLGFRGLVDHVAGEAEVYVDGDAVLAVNGVDTAEETTAVWRGVYVGFSSDWIIGHLYVLDGSGAFTALRKGAFVVALESTATGSHAQYTPSGAATLHEAVDDTDPDDDTTHIKAAAIPLPKYSLVMATLADTPVVYGVQETALVKNSVAGLNYANLAVVNGTTYVDGWQSADTAAWRALQTLWAANPNTGLPWTVGQVNAAEFGGLLDA